MAVDPADSRSKVVVGHVFLDPHAATARQDGGGGSRPAPPLTPDTASADDWSAVGSSSSDDGLDARAVPADAAGSGGRDGPAAPPLPLRRCRMSIQVTLEETGKCGRYRLKSDDSDLLEILRKGVDQEQASMVTTAGQAPAPKAKVRIRDLVFTRRFTTFDRQNPLTAESPFHGFFTLFWLMCAALLIRVAANNQRAHGSVFGGNELMHMMFDRDVIVMGITDGVMCAGTAFGLLLQKLILKGYLTWNKSGWILQHAWQACYLAAVVGWTFYRDWPWTHTCFIVLHAMVFLMKQHSYSSYNGYRRPCPLHSLRISKVADHVSFLQCRRSIDESSYCKRSSGS